MEDDVLLHGSTDGAITGLLRLPDPLLAGRAKLGNYFAIVLFSMAMEGIAFFLTLFVQRSWHYSTMHTVLAFLPMTALLVACPRASDPLQRRFGTAR
ncbi:hypothetical protein [Actinocatenispora sera]|uniref:hypothetical protein n=1 Tax=Actinocatenispora sera TaxID=390989 RepID=UPI0012ED9943|nr:hypothetical protein [Actinocatenispora sera]